MSAPVYQNLSDLEAAFTAGGYSREGWTPVLARIRTYFRRYTDLERNLLGKVDVRIPEHLLDADLSLDPLMAAEQMAGRERARMALLGEETGDVMRLLDREGLKVYLPPFPESTEVEGFFLFDGEAGPLMVVDGSLEASSVDFAFARLYANFLFDHDPYSIRLLRRGSLDEDPAAVRARAFAAAFLVPADRLENYLKALRWKPEHGWPPATLDQLALYFEVGYVPLLSRLLALGYLDAEDTAELLPQLGLSSPPEMRERPRVLPERFVRLALEHHARGGLGEADLASYLECDREAARRLAGRFQLDAGNDDEPTAEEEGDEGPDA